MSDKSVWATCPRSISELESVLSTQASICGVNPESGMVYFELNPLATEAEQMLLRDRMHRLGLSFVPTRLELLKERMA